MNGIEEIYQNGHSKLYTQNNVCIMKTRVFMRFLMCVQVVDQCALKKDKACMNG